MAAWGVGPGEFIVASSSGFCCVASTIEMPTAWEKVLILLIFLTLAGARQLIELMIWEDAAQIGVLDAPWCLS